MTSAMSLSIRKAMVMNKHRVQIKDFGALNNWALATYMISFMIIHGSSGLL